MVSGKFACYKVRTSWLVQQCTSARNSSRGAIVSLYSIYAI